MKPKQNIDIVITGNVAWLDNVSWSVKILYGLIRGLTRNDNYCCYASNAYLSEKIGVKSESTIRRYLAKLRKIGVIECYGGYIVAENDAIVYKERLIVLSELQKKFNEKQELLQDLNNKSRKKNSVRACNSARAQACNSAPLNINNVIPCSNNNNLINNKGRNTPQPPCKGAKKAVEQTEQFLTFGKYENVLLTEQQKGVLGKEFGEDLALSLIEQLSAYIKSGAKRFRKKTQHFDVLRYWGLKDKQQASTTGAVNQQTIEEDISGGSFL